MLGTVGRAFTPLARLRPGWPPERSVARPSSLTFEEYAVKSRGFWVDLLLTPWPWLAVLVIATLIVAMKLVSEDAWLTKRENCLRQGLSGEVFQFRWGSGNRNAELRCTEEGTTPPW